MTNVIGLDFDDVLVGFNDGLCVFHNAQYGTYLTREDFVCYPLEKTFGCDKAEVGPRIMAFYRSPEHAAIVPMPGAVDATRELQKKHPVVVITSRPQSVERETRVLLDAHFPSLARDIHFARHSFHGEGSETKGQICRKLGAEGFVDDAPPLVEEVAPFVRQVLLFDAPWNRRYAPSHPNIRRVRSWGEILAFLAETE